MKCDVILLGMSNLISRLSGKEGGAWGRGWGMSYMGMPWTRPTAVPSRSLVILLLQEITLV